MVREKALVLFPFLDLVVVPTELPVLMRMASEQREREGEGRGGGVAS